MDKYGNKFYENLAEELPRESPLSQEALEQSIDMGIQ